MSRSRLAKHIPGLILAAVSGLILCAPAGAATTLAPRSVCPAPAPGYMSCLSVRLVPVSSTRAPADAIPASRAMATHANIPHGPAGGLTPGDLVTAYGLGTAAAQPSTATIAIVDAYGDQTIASDLATFDQEYSLPSCTTGSGCLTIVNQYGQTSNLPSPPPADDDWTTETSLDVETAHGICPNCKLLLVQADSASTSDLDAAEDTAAFYPGVSVISDSWGGGEYGADPAFNHPGMTIAAATGDDGYQDWDLGGGGPDYPATSQYVVAVGGTTLNLNSDGSYQSESVWNNDASCDPSTGAGCGGATGGGCSQTFPAPQWQSQNPAWAATGCDTQRAAADVSADADPDTGMDIYDSSLPQNNCNGSDCWERVGGTSLATPIVAAVFALAGGANGIDYPAQTLYANQQATPSTLHDVTSGSNVNPAQFYVANPDITTACTAAAGYDAPSGVGTPNGIGAFTPVGGEVSESPLGGSDTSEGTQPCGGDGTTDGSSAPTPEVAPTAVIAPIGSATVGTPVTLNGAGSFATNASVTSWTWNTGDDSETAGEVIQHTFNAPGTYLVSLRVTDTNLNAGTTGVWITVTSAKAATSTASPRLQSAGSVTVKTSRGKVTVSLGRELVCPSAFSSCSAAVTLTMESHGRSVTIGHATLGAAGGQLTVLKLTLNATGTKALAHSRSLHARYAVVLNGNGSARSTASITLTLRAPAQLARS